MPEMTDRAGFARGGLAAMPALDDAPELYRPALAPDDPLARHDARRDEDFALRAAAQATALTRALSGAPPEGEPDGFAARLLARFDDESQSLIENAPSPRAEEAARAAIGRARGRLADWALPQEAAAQTVARRQTLIDTLAQFRAAAAQQPDDVDALRAEGAAAIAGATSWLGAGEARQIDRQWTAEIFRTSAQALIETDPDEALQRLTNGRYRNRLNPLQIMELRGAAKDRLRSIALDRAEIASESTLNSELEKESDRAKFHAQFLNALRNGEARYIDIYQAAREGRISPKDRTFYEASLAKAQAEWSSEKDKALRVSSFIDGQHSVPPNAEETRAHFDLVMQPILKAVPIEQEGRFYADYLESLGRYRSPTQAVSVEAGISPPQDEAVDPQAVYKMLAYDGSKGEVARSMEDVGGGFDALSSAIQAERHTNKLFAGLPTHNNAADAFRHAYWSFLLTRQFLETGQNGPEKAKKFTDAHEAEHFKKTLFGWLPESATGVRQWPEDERLMDLFNNEIGRRLAILPENAGRSAEDVIWQALREGRLQTRPMRIKIGNAQ
jgi:hypothetical protein